MSTNRLQKMGCTGRITALLAPVALLSACADASLSKPEIRLPGAFQTSATAANADLPTASLDRWWTLFGDPQLETLVEQALVAAPDARTAVARLEEALALRSERMRSLLPQGNLQGSATHQETNQSSSGSGGFAGFNTPGGLDTLSLQFAPSWEIDLFGRSRTARRIADADLATTRFNVEAARMSLAANVGRQLFQARALAIQLEDARESRRISAELTRVTGIRAERGLGTRADAARVRTDLESAEAEIVRLEAALRAATPDAAGPARPGCGSARKPPDRGAHRRSARPTGHHARRPPRPPPRRARGGGAAARRRRDGQTSTVWRCSRPSRCGRAPPSAAQAGPTRRPRRCGRSAWTLLCRCSIARDCWRRCAANAPAASRR